MPATPPAAGSGHGTGAPVKDLLSGLLAGDRRSVEELVQRYLEQTGSPSRVADELIEPAMEEIGERWADNRITVSDEHLATALLQTAMARVFDSVPPEGPTGRRALLACVEDNRHALGLQGLEDAFAHAGWETRFLGADVPIADLVDHIERWEPLVVCLSVALEEHLETAEATVAAIRDALGDRTPTLIVGGPLQASDDRWASTGADAWARTANDAINRAEAVA